MPNARRGASADERSVPVGGEVVERVLHAAGDLAEHAVEVRLGPELLSDVEGRPDLDLDLRREGHARREVEDADAERRPDRDRQDLDAQQPVESQEPCGTLATGDEKG